MSILTVLICLGIWGFTLYHLWTRAPWVKALRIGALVLLVAIPYLVLGYWIYYFFKRDTFVGAPDEPASDGDAPNGEVSAVDLRGTMAKIEEKLNDQSLELLARLEACGRIIASEVLVPTVSVEDTCSRLERLNAVSKHCLSSVEHNMMFGVAIYYAFVIDEQMSGSAFFARSKREIEEQLKKCEFTQEFKPYFIDLIGLYGSTNHGGREFSVDPSLMSRYDLPEVRTDDSDGEQPAEPTPTPAEPTPAEPTPAAVPADSDAAAPSGAGSSAAPAKTVVRRVKTVKKRAADK